MKKQLTGILTAAILATSGSLAVADGHNGNGQGLRALFLRQPWKENLVQLSIWLRKIFGIIKMHLRAGPPQPWQLVISLW